MLIENKTACILSIITKMKSCGKVTICTLLFLFSHLQSLRGQNCWNAPNVYPPDTSDLPLCGNGVLDPGEVCDDGNKVGGDGCNAWCSAFDAMAGACTLAGRNSHCPFGRTVVGSPSQSIFCDLRCIDASPDGKYVVFADAGTLLRMNLFTDQVSNSISILPASISQAFAPVCSLAIFDADSSILVHECTRQRLLLLSADGSISSLVLDLGSILLPFVLNGAKATYYDKKSRNAVVAGIPTPSYSNSGNQNWCIIVYSVDIPLQANYSFSSANGAVLAGIPCVAYNVMERATLYPSFSVQGMHPKYVSLEQCMQMHMPNSMCYVVYMERSDMQFLRAYIPKTGGVDIAYVASTGMMNNALGHPIVKYGSKNMVYTSIGTCFQSKSNIITGQGRVPPTATLGNACRNVPSLGLGCFTPLNNPFITEIMTSPYLLADGLSVSHTHNDLSQIFSSKCRPLSASPSSLNGMVNASGAMLYKNILQSTYANTTPVDFVEIPGVMDIVYITPTSIGLISTKRFTFYDRNNGGYCRATDVIYCKKGYFGDVKTGACFSCSNTSSTGYGSSVAWQIVCGSGGASGSSSSSRRNLLSTTESAPYERFSAVITRDVGETHVTASVCAYLTANGLPCSTSTAMTPLQQYNMAADAADSGLLSTAAKETTLIQCLIAEAEKNTGRKLFRSNAAEYSATWVSAGTNLLAASANVSAFNAKNVPRQPNSSTDELMLHEEEYLNISNKCRWDVPIGGAIRGWLSCSIPYFVNITSSGGNKSSGARRRNLLQQNTNTILQPSDSSLVEHQGLSMASATAISWNNVIADSQSQVTNTNNANSGNNQDQSSKFPIWLGVVIGVAGLGIVVSLLCVFYRGKGIKRASSSSRRND
jgi:cysteine-rich repeat protein